MSRKGASLGKVRHEQRVKRKRARREADRRARVRIASRSKGAAT